MFACDLGTGLYRIQKGSVCKISLPFGGTTVETDISASVLLYVDVHFNINTNKQLGS